MIQDTTFIIDLLRGDSDATKRVELLVFHRVEVVLGAVAEREVDPPHADNPTLFVLLHLECYVRRSEAQAPFEIRKLALIRCSLLCRCEGQ